MNQKYLCKIAAMVAASTLISGAAFAQGNQGTTGTEAQQMGTESTTTDTTTTEAGTMGTDTTGSSAADTTTTTGDTETEAGSDVPMGTGADQESESGVASPGHDMSAPGHDMSSQPETSTATEPSQNEMSSETGVSQSSEVTTDTSSTSASYSGSDLSTDEIRRLQEELNSRTNAGLTVDGIYGPRTSAALRTFQEQNNLSATGSLDQETISQLGISIESEASERRPAGVGSESVMEPEVTPETEGSETQQEGVLPEDSMETEQEDSMTTDPSTETQQEDATSTDESIEVQQEGMSPEESMEMQESTTSEQLGEEPSTP